MAGEERPATTEEIITAYAKMHKIPPALALSVAEQESGFDNTAVSNKGARGIFQLMPDTAKDLGVDSDDPLQNIQGGIKYLKQLSDKYNGDVTKTLQAYNGGMGNVDRGTISSDAQIYATDVMRRLSTRMRTQATTPAPTFAGAVTTTAITPVKAALTAAPAAPAQGAPPAGTPLPPGATAGMLPSDTKTAPGQRPTYRRLVSSRGGNAYVDTPVPALGEEAGGVQAMRAMAQGVDPRTAEGRENIAGIGGSVALGYATGGMSEVAGVLPWLARVVGPAIGAATAGATEAGAEQVLGTAPPSPNAVTEAGIRQGAYELGGQAMMWPLRRVARSALGARVGKLATTALEQTTQEARRMGTAALDAVRTRVAEGIEAARTLAQATAAATRETSRRAIATAREAAGKQTADVAARAGSMVAGSKRHAADLLAVTELDNAAVLSDLTKQYDNLLANPPSTMQAGQLTKTAVEGPAKRALDLAGQRVNEAAQRGPMIKLAPIQAALEDMAKKARPAAIFAEPAAGPAIGFQLGAGSKAAMVAQLGEEGAAKQIAAMLGVPETHPLPGLLGKIQSAPESISFADAHKLKMLLDEGVNWDRTAKKHLEKITKGLRTTLREALSVHEPYNVATQAYQAMVPLYRRGIGKQVITAAVNNPDAIARTLNAKNPAQALALRDLLLTQSAAGGDPIAGQRAWDAVRSTFVYNNVLKGGIKDLSGRVHALVEQSPEFAKAVLHDEASQRVMSNLDRLGQAYQTALQSAEEHLGRVKATGSQLVDASKAYGQEEIAAAGAHGASQVESARRAAAEAIRKTRASGAAHVGIARRTGAAEISTTKQAARAGVDAAKAQQTKLAESSLRKSTITGQLSDLLRATSLGPKSIWGALSLVRLLEGPQAKDLIEWAAYSDANTQRLVSVITGSVPDRVASGVLRDVINALSVDESQLEPSPDAAPGTRVAAR